MVQGKRAPVPSVTGMTLWDWGQLPRSRHPRWHGRWHHDGVALAQSPALAAPELTLARLAVDLGARQVGGPLTEDERSLASAAALEPATSEQELERIRRLVRAGGDPLGSMLCAVRPPEVRRPVGAFYTPSAIVEPMVAWILARDPTRVVDAGCGSGRFAAAVLRRRPQVPVVAVDVDPMATILTRATLAVLEAPHVTVLQADYTALSLPPSPGRTAWIGNPPYVRHHDLSPQMKAWAANVSERLGHRASGLSGLHAYFFLATALYSRPGDVGCFVTSAEWLDVGWGSVVRHLLVNGLGGIGLDVLTPTAVPFEDAMTTAVIVSFEAGARPAGMHLRLVERLADLREVASGTLVDRERLLTGSRWTSLLRVTAGDEHHDLIPLGRVARVHRGVATGANDYFVMTRERARALGIERWCRPAITRASEILDSGGVVRDGPNRLLLLDLPADVDRSANPELDAYLRLGEESRGGNPPICAGYLASHRTPWWRVGGTAPPPIVASYMARRAPKFALNPDGLAILNIAHGVYPREHVADDELAALVRLLNEASGGFRGNGRTYHGGLEKFEPREMEALLIRPPWSRVA